MKFPMADNDGTRDGNVQSVERAFALLAELNRQRISTIANLHETLKLPKPTIVRLLKTLAGLGYVNNDKRQGGYLVTSAVQGLSSGYHGDPLVVEAGRPWAVEFTRRHRWPIAIAVLDFDAVIVRCSTITDSPISPFHATINKRLPMLTRALGRAYISFCPPDERDMLLATLAASGHPENAMARTLPEAMRIIEATRAAGYAIRAMNVEPRSSSTVAVPIRSSGKVLATIGMTYFRSAVPLQEIARTYAPLLQECARNIEASLAALQR